MTRRFKKAPEGFERRQQKAALLFECEIWYLALFFLQVGREFSFLMMVSGVNIIIWSLLYNLYIGLAWSIQYDFLQIGFTLGVSGFLGWERFIGLSCEVCTDLRELNTMLDRLG